MTRARYVLIMGVHHDNFDLWDSKYQPWNSVNIGPKRDMLGEWKRAALKNDMRFWRFLPSRVFVVVVSTGVRRGPDRPEGGCAFTTRISKPMAKANGGTVTIPHNSTPSGSPVIPNTSRSTTSRTVVRDFLHLDYARTYATQWAQRIQDVIEKLTILTSSTRTAIPRNPSAAKER